MSNDHEMNKISPIEQVSAIAKPKNFMFRWFTAPTWMKMEVLQTKITHSMRIMKRSLFFFYSCSFLKISLTCSETRYSPLKNKEKKEKSNNEFPSDGKSSGRKKNEPDQKSKNLYPIKINIFISSYKYIYPFF